MTDYEDDDDYEDDLDLNTLPDDELVEQMHDDLYNGLKEEVAEGTQILLDRGWDANKVLNEALVAGMTIVGIDFRDGILFVPEVLMSANSMKAGMALLKPLLSLSDQPTAGKMVIGTVKGDIHDIGKNLVAEHKPEILGMSALLTTTMPYMKVVIDTMKEQGIRDDYIVLVGGAPLNQEFGEAIGANAYCRDAAVAADTARELVAEMRAG
jgi:5-methyltetrahydrofolate--homocysteine methyltransferase